MKLLSAIILIVSLCFTTSFAKNSSYKSTTKSSTSKKSSSDISVKGYTKKDGTAVSSYKRTPPNTSKKDNYSTKGNINPYTGKVGTKNSY